METLLACLTAPGKAAIATLALRGPQAWPIARQLFKPRKGSLPEEPSADSFWFGKLGQDHADDVILAVKQASPTPCLEIHCHGGVEVVRMIQELHVERGVRVVPWQQFFDGSAISDLLAHAPTLRTASILLDQACGAWSQCVGDLQDRKRKGQQYEFNRDVRRLAELIPLGQHLIEPWRIVIAGAPNVGKSSLMNALAGFTRSVVAATPGTTRDVVTTRIAIDGWSIELIDTAGIRLAPGALEQQGIERAFAAVRGADLRFWMLDGSAEEVWPADPEGYLLLINKTDLPAAWDWQRAQQAMQISAHTHAGLARLCEMISQRLVPKPPERGEAVPCLPEQVDWVRTAVQSCPPICSVK